MAQTYNLPSKPLIVKYRGIFDQEGLLRKVYDWLTHQYYDVQESSYKHKIPDPRGAEQEIKVTAEKKVSGYLQFNIKLHFRIFDLKEVEVVKDNQKKKMNQGRIEIRISGTVAVDYKNNFEKSQFLKRLRDFMHKFVMKEDIEYWWQDEFYYRLYKLQQTIKEFLEMESSYNAFESWW